MQSLHQALASYARSTAPAPSALCPPRTIEEWDALPQHVKDAAAANGGVLDYFDDSVIWFPRLLEADTPPLHPDVERRRPAVNIPRTTADEATIPPHIADRLAYDGMFNRHLDYGVVWNQSTLTLFPSPAKTPKRGVWWHVRSCFGWAPIT